MMVGFAPHPCRSTAIFLRREADIQITTGSGTKPPFSARRLNDGLRQEQPLEATSNIIFSRLKLVSLPLAAPPTWHHPCRR